MMKKILDYLRKYFFNFVIVFIIIIFVLYIPGVRFFYPKMSDRGLFGDMFGGINAFLSGLAFIGVLYSLILQRKEFENVVKTQKKSEQVLHEQVKSMEKTAKLNGLSSILQSLGSSLVAATTGKYPDPSLRDSIVQEMEKIKQEIKKEIENK